MRSMSKVGRSRVIPSGPTPQRTVRSLTRAQMYRPQIGLKLGMEKKLTPGNAVGDLDGGALTDLDGEILTDLS